MTLRTIDKRKSIDKNDAKRIDEFSAERTLSVCPPGESVGVQSDCIGCKGEADEHEVGFIVL